MDRIKRAFDAIEVTQDFLDFYERTGCIPTIHIGTDSQIHTFRRTRVFRFVTVVLMHYNTVDPEFRIAKAWGKKDFERASMFIGDNGKMNIKYRMIHEASLTLAVAEELCDQGIIDKDCVMIGIDVNDSPDHESNLALKTIVGMCQGYGYPNYQWKPDSLVTYAADRLSK